MNRTARIAVTLAISSILTLGLAACSSDAEDGASDEANITPTAAKNTWGLAGLCSENIARHKAVKAQELASGVVRWQCGDRPGVDGEQDRGQEYCEYFAVSNGKRINQLSRADRAKPLSCFFTSVYADVDNRFGAVGEIDKKLATELSSKENLAATIDPALVRMKGRFNTRGAATTLIVDSFNASKSQDKGHVRTAACFLAAKKKGSTELKRACEGVDLSKDANWAKAQQLGATIPTAGEDLELQNDMVACMGVERLSHGGVDWRMSDPHITQITLRATGECSCQYEEVPTALEGFLQGTWATPDQLPPGCRRVKVGGKDYMQMTICDVPAPAIEDIELNPDWADNLQAFCNDRFGKDIVMTAPLRVLEKPGSCKARANAFCGEFAKGAR